MENTISQWSLIIESEHKCLCHAGAKLTLGSLQDLYHIVGAHRAVRKCTCQCMTCQRTSLKVVTQLMGQVPTGFSWLCRTSHSEDWNNTKTNLLQSLCGHFCMPNNVLNWCQISQLKHLLLPFAVSFQEEGNRFKSGVTMHHASIVQTKNWRNLDNVFRNKTRKNLLWILLYTGHPVEIQPTNRSSPWFRLGKWGQSWQTSSEAHSRWK